MSRQNEERLVGEVSGHETSEGLNYCTGGITGKINRQPGARERICFSAQSQGKKNKVYFPLT